MIPEETRELLVEAMGESIRFDAPMARYTSLRVGGPADAVAVPTDRPALRRLLRTCAAAGIPHAVIGNGFNTLVRDGGMQGVVIRLARFRRLEARPGGCIRIEAGVSHSSLTRFCIDHGLAGLEFGAGIPGSIGGWIAMNAGVPERESRDAVRELEVMSPTGRHLHHLGRETLRFTYRALRGLAPGSLILSALFHVDLGEPAEVQKEIDRHLSKRAGSQPLDVPSCGSVFKNPPGDFAGRLIEAAGLKGHRAGGAEISKTHANFIVNTGGATASDVLELIDEARATVLARSGIQLEPEVRIMGREA